MVLFWFRRFWLRSIFERKKLHHITYHQRDQNSRRLIKRFLFKFKCHCIGHRQMTQLKLKTWIKVKEKEENVLFVCYRKKWNKTTESLSWSFWHASGWMYFIQKRLIFLFDKVHRCSPKNLEKTISQIIIHRRGVMFECMASLKDVHLCHGDGSLLFQERKCQEIVAKSRKKFACLIKSFTLMRCKDANHEW